MKLHPELMLMWVLLIPVYGQAEEKDEQIPPSLELLEFLGQWETDNGEQIDPVALEEGLLEQLGGIETGASNE